MTCPIYVTISTLCDHDSFSVFDFVSFVRSHCRICCAAVCITCHVTVYNTFKICTRCHIKQKEDELSTQIALSAISNASSQDEFGIKNLSFAATNVNSQEKKNEILCSAAKKGIPWSQYCRRVFDLYVFFCKFHLIPNYTLELITSKLIPCVSSTLQYFSHRQVNSLKLCVMKKIYTTTLLLKTCEFILYISYKL